jgi:hypothetical protein
VPRSELVCCRVGWDDVLMAVQLGSAALCLMSEPTAHACCLLVCLHVMGNWHPTRRCGGVRASVCRHIAWTGSWSEIETPRANKQVVGARRRLLVRGGDLSKKLPPSRRLVGEAPN